MRARIAAACLAALVGLGVSGRDVLAQESKPDADKSAQIAASQADYSGRDLVSITPAPLARRANNGRAGLNRVPS